MYLIAMAPPPTGAQCAVVTAILGILAFGCLCMAFRRLRLRSDPLASAKWLPVAAVGGGLTLALAGPIAPGPDAMEHWIGYYALFTSLRFFFGSLAGIAISSIVLCSVDKSDGSKSRRGPFQFRVSELLLLTTLIGVICALFASSAYCAVLVLLQAVVMVGMFAAYVRPRLAHAAPGQMTPADSSAPVVNSGSSYTGRGNRIARWSRPSPTIAIPTKRQPSQPICRKR